MLSQFASRTFLHSECPTLAHCTCVAAGAACTHLLKNRSTLGRKHLCPIPGSCSPLGSIPYHLTYNSYFWQKRKVKMGHFEMVTTLLAAMTLMDAFQVKAEVLDMAENSFDDEYLKCSSRMEMKYIPPLLKEESASHRLLATVWDNAGIMWEARKAQIPVPLNFKDPYGIALMAFVTEAREQTPFYHTFNRAVKMAGQSRKSYIYDFPFKAFHFYLTRALHLLRRPCEDSYKDVVYLTSPGISFTFGEKNQARLGNFTLAYSAKPPIANSQPVLTIHTCFGVAVEKFFGKESERAVLIPLSEVFQVSQEGTGKDLTLHSINKTCSYYDCAFLGGLKTENCIANPEYIEPVYVYNPDLESQKLEDSGRKRLDSTGVPGIQVLQPDENPSWQDENPEDKSQGNAVNPTLGPAPAPAPVPGPKIHPSASSGRMLLPSVTASIVLTVTSAISISTAL
ncbi:ecto-ADP-ribosyltransferase 3 isoform X4 [Mesocricetus auratus]|uniref:NAD(P)(+)--arginine ADP-ribosyltransferase n=1 Tax=Mesocricetus auratus TaxID=10036 RepID=A0ABM2XKT5_MESAU|nr:ecto-ADP-ribosyltransferase 3 isoform X4 [Mesocricetus auratus]